MSERSEIKIDLNKMTLHSESNEQQKVSPRIISDYIKGVCIIVICWHHLIYNNFPEKFSYLGHQVVVFFFILSGYGIYCSLEAEAGKIKKANWLVIFFLKRALRIFPLYWVWLMTSYDLTKLRITDFLLLSLDDPPVWFLNAIIYCYLVAPAFYFLTKKFGFKSILLYAVGILALNAVLDLRQVPVVLGLAYCKMYFLYLFFFGCGMALTNPIKLNLKPVALNSALFLLGLVFVFSALQISMFSLRELMLPYVKIYYFPVNPYVFIFSIAAVLLVIVLVNSTPVLPLRKWVTLFGKYSFSIYLFHGYYVDSIVGFFGKNQPELIYFLIFMLFLPVLLVGCMALEKGVGWIPSIALRKVSVASARA